MVQSSWAIGYAMAALVAGIVLHFFNWRYVFFVGVLPALVTLWIRSGVPGIGDVEEEKPEPRERTSIDRPRPATTHVRRYVSSHHWRSRTFALLLVNFFGLFGWWGLFTWIPPYLSLPVAARRPRLRRC